MVSGKEQYVCRKMKAKCSCGSKKFSQYLNMKKDHGVLFNDNEHPLMNANDHILKENICTFGRCKSICNPHGRLGSSLLGPIGTIGKEFIGCKCEPLTPFPWVQVDENYYIDGAPALTVNSVLHCAYGGEITITLETEDDEEGSTEETQQEEEIDKKEQLPSEVQEKIDSFCDDTPAQELTATGSLELAVGDVAFRAPGAFLETPEMFKYYQEVDIEEIQIAPEHSGGGRRR